MSDAYRGPEEAERARLAQLREELVKRREDLAELGVAVDEPEQARDDPARRWFIVPFMILLFGTAICFASGKFVLALIASVALIFAAINSRLVGGIVAFFVSRLADISRVSEFEDRARVDPPTKKRVELSVDEIAKQKAELRKRREACEEIEREIADAESLLAVEAKKENRR